MSIADREQNTTLNRTSCQEDVDYKLKEAAVAVFLPYLGIPDFVLTNQIDVMCFPSRSVLTQVIIFVLNFSYILVIKTGST